MPGEVTFAVTFAAEVVNVTPMRLLDQVTCAETFWLAPLMMPVAVNCAVARSALPVPLGINMTVALGGSTVSASSPLIGGGAADATDAARAGRTGRPVLGAGAPEGQRPNQDGQHGQFGQRG